VSLRLSGVLLGLAGGIGLGMATQAHGIVTAEGGWRALRATQVWFGGMPSIRSLGYDVPPLPTALELPLVLLPPLHSSPLAGVIVASAAAVLLGWSALGVLRGCGLRRWTVVALTAAILLNPLMLYAVGTGAGDVLGVALLLLGLRLVLDWARDEKNTLALCGGAFAVGFAGLARYDLILVAAALTAVVALMAARQPSQGIAYAIAFGTPAAAMLGLWLVLNGLATGNPLTFVGQAARALAPPGLTFQPALGSWLAACLLTAPLVVAALPGAAIRVVRGRQRTRPALVLGAVALAAPVAAGLGSLVAGSGSPGLLSALALVPLSVVLLGVVVGPLESRRWWPTLVGAAAVGSVLLPLASMASRDEWGAGYPAFIAMLRGEAAAPMWASEQAVAAAIREQSEGRDVLLDDRREALPALFVGSTNHLIATADPDFGAVLSDPRGRARLILIQIHVQVQTAGREDEITAAWPRLSGVGVAWAEQVGEWPVTGDPQGKYRLFRVNG
jgi:hypothetical protein